MPGWHCKEIVTHQFHSRSLKLTVSETVNRIHLPAKLRNASSFCDAPSVSWVAGQSVFIAKRLFSVIAEKHVTRGRRGVTFGEH